MLLAIRSLKLVVILWMSFVVAGSLGKDFYNVQRQSDVNHEDIISLDKRVTDLEALHIEGQVSKLTALVETDHEILTGIAVAVALMALETLFRIGGRKKEA